MQRQAPYKLRTKQRTTTLHNDHILAILQRRFTNYKFIMSYRDPYSNPYNGSGHQTNQADVVHSDGNFDFDPYSHLSHPTYSQSGYGAGGNGAYADDPTYPPQRQSTQRTQRNGSENPTQRKETYRPDAGMVRLTKQ